MCIGSAKVALETPYVEDIDDVLCCEAFPAMLLKNLESFGIRPHPRGLDVLCLSFLFWFAADDIGAVDVASVDRFLFGIIFAYFLRMTGIIGVMLRNELWYSSRQLKS